MKEGELQMGTEAKRDDIWVTERRTLRRSQCPPACPMVVINVCVWQEDGKDVWSVDAFPVVALETVVYREWGKRVARGNFDDRRNFTSNEAAMKQGWRVSEAEDVSYGAIYAAYSDYGPCLLSTLETWIDCSNEKK